MLGYDLEVRCGGVRMRVGLGGYLIWNEEMRVFQGVVHVLMN